MTNKCPECGCVVYTNKDAVGIGYRVCDQCKQEWWTDIDYRGNMSKQKAVVFDLEGTLSDHSNRLHFLENGDYDSYNHFFQDDKPNQDMVDLMKKWHKKGYHILLVTAKSIAYGSIVDEWLTEYNFRGLFTQLYFRKENDNRRSVEVKKDIFKKLMSEYDIVMSYDDRLENVDMLQSLGIPAILCPGGINPKQAPITPDTVLKQAAETFKQKNEEYGAAYLRHGNIMAAYFPNGITLKTPDEFFRYHLFELDVIKSNRLASTKLTHKDSWRDKSVYAAMGECSINNQGE